MQVMLPSIYIQWVGSYSTHIWSSSTLDGELQHTGLANLLPELLLEDVEEFLGKKSYQQYQKTQLYIAGSLYLSVKLPFKLAPN
jgi:hypothetical protein